VLPSTSAGPPGPYRVDSSNKTMGGGIAGSTVISIGAPPVSEGDANDHAICPYPR
jgi:hypothetical protein